MVSIIIPIYNAEKYISKCIESIIGQTYKDLEVILVDDGSKDKSLDICKEYSNKYDFIRTLHIENHGASYARNVGIEKAKGEYIQFVDSDDYLERTMIETLLYEQSRRKSDIVLCGYYIERPARTEVVIPDVMDGSINDFEKLIAYWVFDALIGSPWNKIFNSRIIKENKIRFKEGMNYAEDYCFCMNYYSHISKFSTIDKAFYHYQDTPNSLTKKNKKDTDKFWKDQYIACTSLFEFLKCKQIDVQQSEAAKQAYSVSCALNFYRRVLDKGFFSSVKWLRNEVSQSEYRQLIKHTNQLSRVGKLKYVFKIIKMLC